MIRQPGMNPALDRWKRPGSSFRWRQIAGRADEHDDLRIPRSDAGLNLPQRTHPYVIAFAAAAPITKGDVHGSRDVPYVVMVSPPV